MGIGCDIRRKRTRVVVPGAHSASRGDPWDLAKWRLVTSALYAVGGEGEQQAPWSKVLF